MVGTIAPEGEAPTAGPQAGAGDREAAQEAASVDRVAVLLHDLRTPLAAMRTAAEMIGADPTTQRQASALRTLEMAIDALLSMTTQGLAGTTPEDEDACDVATDILSVCELFSAEARVRGLAERRDIAAGLANYRVADPLALRRILSVLYDNALKYTAEGGLTLTARVGGEGAREGGGAGAPELELSLADTGIGIPGEERGLLFRARRRGELARDTATGSGLGLWSASRLAVAQGGRLELAESSPAGSRFSLRLPLRPFEGGGAVRGNGKPGGRRERPNIRCLVRRRLLVVDDNEANRKMMEAMLGAFGCDTLLASGGREALELLAREPVDAVLLDINMPGMDGIETLAEIRGRGDAAARLPVLGITAATLSAREREDLSGFDLLLEKPVLPAALFSALDRAIAGRAG
ncbi:hybrid sensor histidine kinase/response regulator [Stappia indica]|uniref:histidine kinase n=1 Tax=Stappia indica TaxID=538381 RepID=A0A857C7Z0_9HYPH|nr:hybrid sensor histidine kinase/response regulator [Stappia indica]QGZ35053.1 response regulator [Stappia indica]